VGKSFKGSVGKMKKENSRRATAGKCRGTMGGITTSRVELDEPKSWGVKKQLYNISVPKHTNDMTQMTKRGAASWGAFNKGT